MPSLFEMPGRPFTDKRDLILAGVIVGLCFLLWVLA